MANESVIDIFIQNATRSEFLNRCARDDRRVPELAVKFTCGQVVQTLRNFLLDEHSG